MKKRRVLYLALVVLLIVLSLWVLQRGGGTLDPDIAPQTEPAEVQGLQLLETETVPTAEPAPATEAPAPETTDTPVPDTETPVPEPQQSEPSEPLLDEDGSYYSKEEVALYIHQYGKLPDNFITKKEAEALGWTGGSLEPYAPGKVLGGTYFGNYEGLLPSAPGRKYTECDIDTKGQRSRGAKRIVFSNDGLIYYTDDHYETFELLYGEDDS